MIRRNMIIAMAAITASAAAAGAVVADDKTDQSVQRERIEATGGSSPQRSEIPAMKVPTQLTASFSILRRPASATEAASKEPTPYGANGALGRSSQDGKVRVIPGQTGVCLRLETLGGSCAGTTQAIAGALIVSKRDETGRLLRLVGLAADDVKAVEAADGQGAWRPVSLVANVYSTDQLASTVRLHFGSGKSQDITVP